MGMAMITWAHWRHTSIALPRSLHERQLRIWKANDRRFHDRSRSHETFWNSPIWSSQAEEWWCWWQLFPRSPLTTNVKVFATFFFSTLATYLIHSLIGPVLIHLCRQNLHVHLRWWWMSNWAILIWHIEIISDFLLIQSVFLWYLYLGFSWTFHPTF